MAYSTVSQLGYMFMALGAGVGNVAQLAVVAAMFHLFTHAFFKALLFLASGSVMHAMGDVIDMRRFGGLRHRHADTPAGRSPSAAWRWRASRRWRGSSARTRSSWPSRPPSHESHEMGWGWVYGLIYWLAIVTAFLTAFYTGRAYFLTFWGPEKLPSPDDPEADRRTEACTPRPPRATGHEHDDAHGTAVHEIGHESPPVMTIPLMILAGCTVLIGLICLVAGRSTGRPVVRRAPAQDAGFEELGHAEHGFT